MTLAVVEQRIGRQFGATLLATPLFDSGDESSAESTATPTGANENSFEERDRGGLAAVDVIRPQRDLGKPGHFILRHGDERLDTRIGSRDPLLGFGTALGERLVGPQRESQLGQRLDVGRRGEPDHRPRYSAP